ncbi:AD039 HT014 THIOREDOXIN FAMILY TRP26 [Salix viminalis]|uniref:AD039 HT014 THIOREDOXIN FAMILY TRP26 n=1 Tax=Salix viminalis TaxID=40686 RepID=A0A9Q0UVX9_SALVM|nr:AD039 HT014 THIOREDOXIN FAMILY TRP26 [Salix viminalis]
MSAESATAIPRGQVDLLDFIDFSGVECLNQSTSHSLSNAIKQGYREDDEDGPKTVKLFSNKEHMGFSNVNDYPPSDTVVLSPDTLKGKPVVLKYVKFQNVRSLAIFIEDNQLESEITKVQKISLFGTTLWDSYFLDAVKFCIAPNALQTLREHRIMSFTPA